MERDLAKRVSEGLSQAGLGRYGLKVRCHQGLVTLQGIVDVLAEKTRAAEIAGQFPGVAGVENDLTVCTDGGIDDEEVAMEVAEELAATPLGPRVGAEVIGGRVHLVGQVPAVSEAYDAIEAASTARGAKAVANDLSLPAEAARDDPSLVNEIRNALAESLGPEARSVKISAREGCITLAGEAVSPATVARAGDLAATIAGVRRVENRLRLALEPHDRILGGITARIQADPDLAGAGISFRLEEGRLLAEGELHDLAGKKALERALRQTWDEYRLELRGLDNRVRLQIAETARD